MGKAALFIDLKASRYSERMPALRPRFTMVYLNPAVLDSVFKVLATNLKLLVVL